MTEYVSLHNHTEFSILDSLITPKELFQRAKELGQKAVAVTDHGTFAGIWDSFKSSKETGVKAIVGCEYYFVDDVSDKDQRIRHVILLARNATGYRNMLLLNRKGFDNLRSFGKKTYPIIDWKLLQEHREGTICLTACGGGIVSQLINTKKFDEAEKTIVRLKEMFGEYFGLEIQPNNLKRFSTNYNDNIDQYFTNHHLIRFGKKHNVKIVPTSNAHYVKRDDAETHDVMLAIGSGQPIYSNARLNYTWKETPDFYLHSTEEIKTFFSRTNDETLVESWIGNSEWFADQCENPEWVDPKYSNPSGKEWPVFPVVDQPDYVEFKNWLATQNDNVKNAAEDTAYLRYSCERVFDSMVPKGKESEYRARMEEELSVFDYCGASSYMLVVADFIDWAKKHNVSVGPGRGSAPGSLVGYFLNIHIADPIKYDLVFERFYSKLRTASADIDSDFATSGRNKVEEYIINKYGSDSVAHVSNFNTITPKVFARDVSRSCEFGNDRQEAVNKGDEIAGAIPKDAHSIDQAIELSPLYEQYTERYPQLSKFKNLCGKYRSTGSHAAGIILGSRPLVGLVPLRKDSDGTIALEFEKERAEENGLVKMDLLGLSTLDVIDKTKEIINKQGKTLQKINYDEYNEKTYNLISSGNTMGVFQFGTSAGTIDLCKKIKPKSIEDLAVITTLARPASREIRGEFVETKNGQKPVTLAHPLLKRAFGKTLGYPLYDESLLVLANDVAGWDLAESDKLRKLTKEKGKNPAKVKKWRQEFIDGAISNGVEQVTAEEIWTDIIEPFSGYSFNKSLYLNEKVDIYSGDGKFITNKPINKINKGEFVRSRDESTNNNIFVEVKNLHDHGELPVFEVELETGEKVICTMDHKFRVMETGEMLPLRKIVMEKLSIVVDTVR